MGKAIIDVLSHEVEGTVTTMSVEEYNQKMRAVQLGESDTLPDGTPVAEIRKNLARMEKEQEEARANLKYTTLEDVAHPAEETGEMTVISTPAGVIATPVVSKSEIPEPGSDAIGVPSGPAVNADVTTATDQAAADQTSQTLQTPPE